jgi:hypothetical protein
MRLPGLLLLAVVVCACGRADPEYFPLNEGWVWRYRIVLTTEDRNWEQRYIITNLPRESSDNTLLVPQQTIDGRRIYYRVDDDGIVRMRSAVAGKSDIAPGDRVLPSDPGAGTSWRGNATTVALMKIGPPQETLFRVSVEMPVTYLIEATDDHVSVPAGNFSNCLRIYGSGKINTDAGNYVGRTNVGIESWDWYAPGVGLVKSLRRETTSSAALKYGELLMELQSLEK